MFMHTHTHTRYTDNLKLNFSRTPVNECDLKCTQCEVTLDPWPRPVLEHTTVIRAQIGQSGGERGYAGITGGEPLCKL